MSWARVGMKVVCVDAGWRVAKAAPLVKGAVYTVSNVFSDPIPGYYGPHILPEAVIELVEVKNPSAEGFAIERFRPLVSQADDVAKFTYLLTPSKLDILCEELNR